MVFMGCVNDNQFFEVESSRVHGQYQKPQDRDMCRAVKVAMRLVVKSARARSVAQSDQGVCKDKL